VNKDFQSVSQSIKTDTANVYEMPMVLIMLLFMYLLI